MTHAQMTVAVIAARLATGGAFSPLTARAFVVIRAQSSAAAGVRVAGLGREEIGGSASGLAHRPWRWPGPRLK
jgi:hypothetical protein